MPTFEQVILSGEHHKHANAEGVFGTGVEVHSIATSNDLRTAFLFENVTIPRYYHVSRATFKAHTQNTNEAGRGEVNARLYVASALNPTMPTTAAALRGTSTNSSYATVKIINGEPLEWKDWSIAKLIHEQVNKSGWTSGNNILFILRAVPTDLSLGRRVIFRAYGYGAGWRPEFSATYNAPPAVTGGSTRGVPQPRIFALGEFGPRPMDATLGLIAPAPGLIASAETDSRNGFSVLGIPSPGLVAAGESTDVRAALEQGVPAPGLDAKIVVSARYPASGSYTVERDLGEWIVLYPNANAADDPRNPALYRYERRTNLERTFIPENRLRRSEDFTHAAWELSNVTIDGARLTPTATTGERGMLQTLGLADSQPYTVELEVRPQGLRWFRVTTRDNSGADAATWFDLQTQTLGTSDAAHSGASVEAVGDGFYRVRLIANSGAGLTAGLVQLRFADDNNVLTHSGIGSLDVRRPLVHLGDAPKPYVPTADTVVVGTVEETRLDTLYTFIEADGVATVPRTLSAEGTGLTIEPPYVSQGAGQLAEYETLEQTYEAGLSVYETVRRDCFDGLHKLFAASYYRAPQDAKEIFAVIAWELCRVKAEIEQLRWLRDSQRIPPAFIGPLAEMLGIENFPVNAYPEEQRRVITFYQEAIRYKGSSYGLELLLKSLLPRDTYVLELMYRRGLRTYDRNNDFTGGTLYGTGNFEKQAQRQAGLAVDHLTFGPKTFPTGIRIVVFTQGARTLRVVRGLVDRIRPVIDSFMPENSFYEFDIRPALNETGGV